MTFFRIYCLVLFFAVVGFPACNGSNPDSGSPPETEEPRPAGAPQLFVDQGDLAAIQKRGTLRVVLFDSAEAFLPRREMPGRREMIVAGRFAEHLGVQAQMMRASRFDQVIPLLRDGKVDLIAARLTVTAARKNLVAFTGSRRMVDEMLVGRTGASGLPKRVEDLAGRAVHVRSRSSYAASLTALNRKLRPPMKIVPLDESVDDEEALSRVGDGSIPFTVVDSDVLEAAAAYNPDVAGVLAVRKGAETAWAVRPQNPDLLAAANAFLVKHALSRHTRRLHTDDLDEIKQRQIIRVLTRNNAVTYFQHQGRQRGFDYEIARLMAKRLGIHLEMVVPPDAADLIPWLLEGRGDVIAASLTVTPERRQKVAFTLPYLYVNEMLVGPSGATPMKSLADLRDREIHVRVSSTYAATLRGLQPRYGPFKVVPAAEDLETEMLLEQVGRGQMPFTVADSHIFSAERVFNDRIKPLARLTAAPSDARDLRGKPRTAGKEIAFAVRKNNPQLLGFLDSFVKKIYRGGDYNTIRRRYFENRKVMAAARESMQEKGRISPYDALLKKYSARYGFDWRLMAAQAYQESRFRPKARSHSGALGLFQVMPATGRDMGFSNLTDPEASTHAGIKYMAWVLKRFDKRLPLRERLRFALASYNAGLGHVIDARRLARARKLDPDVWFGNVEQAMLLLKDPKVYRHTRYGYCRADEPVNYVSQILIRYKNYGEIVPQ